MGFENSNGDIFPDGKRITMAAYARSPYIDIDMPQRPGTQMPDRSVAGRSGGTVEHSRVTGEDKLYHAYCATAALQVTGLNIWLKLTA